MQDSLVDLCTVDQFKAECREWGEAIVQSRQDEKAILASSLKGMEAMYAFLSYILIYLFL